MQRGDGGVVGAITSCLGSGLAGVWACAGGIRPPEIRLRSNHPVALYVTSLVGIHLQ